jgi:hypothetical protein
MLVRLSRVLDPCAGFRLGKTVIGIFVAPATGPA